MRKKWISHENPERYLMEHVLKGDSGDGVPNILSSDNCLVVGERQKPLTQKKIDGLIELNLDGKFDHPLFKNYMRNKTLIDLKNVPSEISAKIIESYDKQEGKGRDKLMNYFMANKLKNLMESVGEF